MKKIGVSLLIVGLGLLLGLYLFHDKLLVYFFKPTPTNLPTSSPLARTTEQGDAVQVVAEDLQIPWEIVFLPDQSLLVTERPGQLLHIAADGRSSIPVEGVEHVGEGGLMGMALHPRFTENKWLYLYLTTRSEEGLINRVERYVFDQSTNSLSDKNIILSNIPGANNHDGGRIAFGPDDMLYITTGDAQREQLAQDTNSLAGKILRVTDEGAVPPDNPFGNEVYSYGHRNPQGLDWDAQGRLWVAEHGPSGASTGYDEVNLVEKGQNYGWPIIRGDATREGMRAPIIQSGGEDTWAPAGLLVVGDVVYVAGLRGESLYTATITGDTLTNFMANARQEFGRLRVVQQGPDEWIYVATSNTDGRGEPQAGDDKIIKINPVVFQ